MAKESGVYNESRIEEGKEVLYSLMELGPRTFREFRSQQYRGSPFYHSHFLGICVKRLKEEGRVVGREVRTPDGGTDTEFYPVKGMIKKIRVRARHVAEDIYDSFLSIWRKKWVEQDTGSVSMTYPPGHFSAYLAFCTMKRSERKEHRKSGWEVAYRPLPEYKRARGRKSTVSGDVVMEMDVMNARGNTWFDRISFNLTFKRAKREDMRIIPAKHRAYTEKIFDSISEIGLRSQVTELYADRILVASGKEDGSVDMHKARGIIDEIEEICPDRNSEISGPMLRDFYCPRLRAPKDLERHKELVTYLRQRVREKAEYCGLMPRPAIQVV